MGKFLNTTIKAMLMAMIVVTGSGQDTIASDRKDSLRNVNAVLPENEEKACNFLEIAELYYDDNDWDSAVKYTEEAVALGKRLDNERILSRAWYKQSLIYGKMGDLQTSLRKAESSLHAAIAINDSSSIAKGYYQCGNLMRSLGELDTAVLSYRKSLEFFNETGNTLGVLANYNALGNTYAQYSMYDSAAYYFLKSAAICEGSGLEKPLGTIWNNVTKAYIGMNDHENALNYLEKSYRINKNFNQTMELAHNHLHYGMILIEQGKLEESLEHYRLADSIYSLLGSRLGQAHVSNNTGEVYEKQGKYELAMEKYDDAQKFYTEQDHTEGIIVSLQNKADIYSYQGKYDLALAYGDSALAIAGRSGYRNREKEIYRDMARDYHRAGAYRQAYEYHQRYQELSDSIFNMEKAAMIADLTLKYEKERDQAKILKLQNENLEKDLALRKRTSQRNLSLFISLGAILLVLFISLYFRQRAIKNRQITEQKIKRLEEEKKVLAAKALVEGQEDERKRVARELHDGLGTLLSVTRMQFSTIRSKIPENRQIIEKAVKLLEQASSDVRRISHNMMPGLLTKFGLYEAVENLVDEMKEIEGLTVEAIIPDENAARIPENKEIMVYRIIQEMFNNTLKHANAKNISLQMHLVQGNLHIIFSDDGIGFDAEKVSDSKSAGLASIRSRVNFLNGSLSLETKPGHGSRYIIGIPL